MFVGIEKFIKEKWCVKGRKNEPMDTEGNLAAFKEEEAFDKNSCLEDLEAKLFINQFLA